MTDESTPITADEAQAVAEEVAVATELPEGVTQEAYDAAVAYGDVIRAEADTMLVAARTHFVDVLGWTVEDALTEIAGQALTRAVLLFGMLPDEIKAALGSAPLLTAPQQ